jgi:hypothetical protein
VAHAQKPDFVFRRNGRIHATRRGRQFNLLLTAEVLGSAGSICTVLERLCSAVLRGMLDTHSIFLLPPSFPLPRVAVCHVILIAFYRRLGQASAYIYMVKGPLENPKPHTVILYGKTALRNQSSTPKKIGSSFLRNDATCLSDYMASHLARQ